MNARRRHDCTAFDVVRTVALSRMLFTPRTPSATEGFEVVHFRIIVPLVFLSKRNAQKYSRGGEGPERERSGGKVVAVLEITLVSVTTVLALLYISN